MRLLAFLVGLFLAFSGVTTLMNPRPLFVGHSKTPWAVQESSGIVEHVSREGAIVYGACATALGIAMICSAVLGDTRIPRNDREIARALLEVSPELMARYGRIEDCTRGQVESTAAEMKVDPSLNPYLLAAFLGKEALRSWENQAPGVDWKEVVERVEGILADFPHEELLRSHFHPTWSGVDGV